MIKRRVFQVTLKSLPEFHDMEWLELSFQEDDLTNSRLERARLTGSLLTMRDLDHQEAYERLLKAMNDPECPEEDKLAVGSFAMSVKQDQLTTDLEV